MLSASLLPAVVSLLFCCCVDTYCLLGYHAPHAHACGEHL